MICVLRAAKLSLAEIEAFLRPRRVCGLGVAAPWRFVAPAHADVRSNAKGRKRLLYKRWRTPLRALDRRQQFLRKRPNVAAVKRAAASMSEIHKRHRPVHAISQKHNV